MRYTIAETHKPRQYALGAYNSRFVAWGCALLFSLIVARSVSTIMFYAFVVASAAIFLLSNTGHCISFLLFLLPFSSILKQGLGSMSFFTVLFFITALKMVLVHREATPSVLLSVILFFVYNFAFSGLGQLTTNLTMTAGLLMLYYARKEPIECNSVIIIFSMGICLASVLALLKSSLPIVNSFVNDVMLKVGDRSYATRFSGLQGNPNYYTMDIIIALSGIIVLMNKGERNAMYTCLFILLSVFGLMSVSKSFLIALVLLLFCWFWLSIRQGAGKLLRFAFVIVVSSAIAYYFAFDSISSYIYRLIGDISGTTGSITTGRTNVWQVYIKEIWDDFGIFLFGSGLNSMGVSERGTHNTYLECMFYLGIVGTTLFLLSLRTSMGRIITEKIMWVPVGLLLVLMVALGMVNYDNLWFYLLVILTLAKECKGSHDDPRHIGGRL